MGRFLEKQQLPFPPRPWWLGQGGGVEQNPCGFERRSFRSEVGVKRPRFAHLPLGLCLLSPVSSPFNFFFFSSLSFNLISSNSTFVVTGVTPGPANPRHAVSLSKRLGQPWESRPRALPPAPPGGDGGGHPRGEPGTRPCRGSSSRTTSALHHPADRRSKDLGGDRHPPSHCRRPWLFLPPLLKGRVIGTQGARRLKTACFPQPSLRFGPSLRRQRHCSRLPGLPGCQSHAPTRLLPTSRPVGHSPFRPSSGTQPSPSSHNGLAVAVIPLVS